MNTVATHLFKFTWWTPFEWTTFSNYVWKEIWMEAMGEGRKIILNNNSWKTNMSIVLKRLHSTSWSVDLCIKYNVILKRNSVLQLNTVFGSDNFVWKCFEVFCKTIQRSKGCNYISTHYETKLNFLSMGVESNIMLRLL